MSLAEADDRLALKNEKEGDTTMRDLARCAIGALLLLNCGRPSLLHAEEPLTVDDAVSEALSHHPAIKASAARVDQAEATHRAVWEAYAPQLSVFGGVQRNHVSGSTTTTTPDGPLTPSTTVVQKFDQNDSRLLSGANVDQFLFDFGSVPAQRRSTEAARHAQLSALETQRLEVTLNVKQSYFGLLRVNQLLAYNRDTVELRERRVADMRSAARDGRPSVDVLQASVDLANAKLNLSRTESDYVNAEAKFLESIGQRARLTRKLVDDVSLKPFSLTLEQATARALATRPELDQTQAMIESEEARADAVRASYLPRVSAFGAVSNLNGVGSSDLDRLTVLSGGINLVIPTAYVVSKARLDQARAAVDELKNRKLELEQSITVGVSRTYAALFAAIERTRVTQELAVTALANWNAIQERYRRRKATILENTESYNFLYSARVSFIQALYDAKIAEAELERAVGQSF